MTLEVSALTELDAVNNIIGTLGESPINTLENLQNVDAINALRILRTISRQEQSRGWSFNLISQFTLNPDVYTNTIPWQENYLYLKGSNGEKLIRYGDVVKDLATDTVVFGSPITAEVILLVPFEHLPEQMRSYIIAKAADVFQSNYFGDDSQSALIQSQIQECWQHLQEYEVDNNDYGLLEHTHVQELLSR